MPQWNRFSNMRNLARVLWKHARSVPRDTFVGLFERVYESAGDIVTLWQLGGATCEFLKVHPDAMAVPVELAETLLDSDKPDARVIGLKLLRYCDVMEEVFIKAIVRALRRRDSYESLGGLYQLSCFLDQYSANRSTIDPHTRMALVDELRQLVAHNDTGSTGTRTRAAAEAELHMARSLLSSLSNPNS